ncbi:hypothetical protein BC826DRAFT_1022611 [Russula brevipes]|nr:hypothetical protein BC826DRAFT_1022611 [Russula brevipes]
MECMSVDDVSAGLSSLEITTTNENSQPMTHAPPPESSGHEPPDSTTTFLSLPWLVKWHIYTHMRSRDCIALSRTCRHMYSFNTLAYTHLQFLPPNGLFALARSIYLLATMLACSPHYAAAVRTVCIDGWNTTDIPEGCSQEAVRSALDTGMRVLLENAPRIYSFTLLHQTELIHCFPQTFTRLTGMRTIRDLRLATFSVPSYIAMCNDPPLDHFPSEVAPALERVWLSVCSGGWLPLVIRDPRHLRWLGLSVLDKIWMPGDADFTATLHRVAEAATELETVVLNQGRHFDAAALGQILQFGFDRGVLGKLRSFSISTVALSLSNLRQLFCGFSRSSVTHLRIVVNHFGRWLCDFGPQYIFELAKLVPDLEEISLDQIGMPRADPLPGNLGAWGEAFQMCKKLRRIVFASMFVLDLCSPRPALEDEEDYEEESGGDEDAGMYVDDSDEGDEGYKSDDDDRVEGAPHGMEAPNLVHLAAWADMFLGDHLRMPAPFAEIWFLDPRFSGRTAAGFNQRVEEGEGKGGRAEHMIYYPILKRDGWWWDELEQIPSD